MITAFGLFTNLYSQPASPTVAKKSVVNTYYPAPRHTQMQMHLTGAESRLTPDKKAQLRQVTLDMFSTNGVKQLSLEAPDCSYDDATRIANSPGRLQVQSGDGKLRITGEGYSMNVTQKTIIISNDVHAVIQGSNNAPPLNITSSWFEFDAERKRGVFHENVRGADAEQEFTCGRLTVSAQTNKSSFDLIEAEQSLVITGRTNDNHASAQRGIFRRAEERVDLIGDAEWQFDGKAGRADRMTARKTDGSYEAIGNVMLKLPRESLGAGGGLLDMKSKGAKSSAGNSVVEVFTDHFTKLGNKIVADGAVRLVDNTNRLSCDRLEVHQATKQSPDETAVATGNVFVESGSTGLHSDRADYSKSAGEIVFTGHPQFEHEQAEGLAQRLTVKTATSEVLADGDVAVKVPLAAGSGSFLGFFPGAETNRVSQKVNIASRNFHLTERQALFAGDVKANQLPVTGSEPRLRADELEVRFGADARHAESLQARQNVVYEQGMAGVTNGPSIYRAMNAQMLTAIADAATGELNELVATGGVQIEQPGTTATGERAVYTRGNEVLKLIGHPKIDAPMAIYTSDQELIWDNARNTLIGSGYNIKVKEEALKQAEESQKLPTP